MNQTHRSRLLLLELVCDLVLFGLCAVVCVALLVQARSMSRESTDLTQAVYLAQEAAEAGLTEGSYTKDGYQIEITRAAAADAPDAILYGVRKDGRDVYALEREVFP